jgi:hypothetical protein
VAKIPNELTQVKNQIVDKPIVIANTAFVAKAGKKVLSALTKETVMAALVHHPETHSPHATRKPANSPRPF